MNGGIDAIAAVFPQHRFPGEDRELSPITGMTRAHWAVTADALLDAVEPYRSPGGGRIDLPGLPSHAGTRSDGLEGFARTFLLAAFRHIGERPGDASSRLERYLPGLVAGTRTPGAEDADSWPDIGDAGDGGQPMVEAASIALALHLTKADSWHRLSADEQERLESWLRGALRRVPGPNNWHLFPMTVASFLEGVGCGDEETARAIGRGLHLLEVWHGG